MKEYEVDQTVGKLTRRSREVTWFDGSDDSSGSYLDSDVRYLCLVLSSSGSYVSNPCATQLRDKP